MLDNNSLISRLFYIVDCKQEERASSDQRNTHKNLRLSSGKLLNPHG